MSKYLLSFLLYILTLFPAYADVIEFFEPGIDGKRLDWCLSWGKDCGQDVAYVWCIKNGYIKAIYWEADKGIGKKYPTMMLNSRQVCNKNSCSGFRTIVCYREFEAITK